MVRVKIGEAVTNRDGIAVFEYTGTGAGKLDVEAISGSVVSQPYEVMDYIVYDTGKTGRDTTKWTNDATSVSTDDNGTTLTRTGVGSYTSNITITGDFEAIVQIKTNGNAIRIGLIDGSNNVSHLLRNHTSDMYLKFRRVGSTITGLQSTDGENWTNQAFESNNVGSNDCKFTFYITGTNERSVTFHDLTIEPL